LASAIVGFEALMRWAHPRLGLIAPDRFIPIAEANGLIVPMGRWAIMTACRTAATWAHTTDGREGVYVTVNVSGRQLAVAGIVDHVAHALDVSGLAPSSLVLEMTESVLVSDPAAVAERLQQLSSLGVKLAIDDFGTGYSSLSYLRQFPIDILKIDKSFTRTITAEEPRPVMLHGLLELARTLDLEIVAEGIERDAQLESLRTQHCQLGQGYLFGRPMSADDIPALLRTHGVRDEASALPLLAT
jgi:EAL domain-containing protein (putative c-di-GMP-specific phosphodiesterase class I)